MAAIYDLHAALNNVLAQTDPILNGLRENRTKLHDEFNRYVGLLEASYNYVDSYLIEQPIPFVNAIRERARDVGKSHRKVFNYFRINKASIAKALSSKTGARRGKSVHLHMRHSSARERQARH